MNRATVRVLFLVPLVIAVLGTMSIFGDHSGWPQPAQIYLNWYRSQPLSGTVLFLNRAALLGLLGLALSTVGLLFFWSPARYVYLASLVLVLFGEIPDIPILASGWENLLNAVGNIVVGTNVALMFAGPAVQYFRRGSGEA